MNSYYDKYKDELLTKKETFRTNEKIIFASTITLGIILILFFYNK